MESWPSEASKSRLDAALATCLEHGDPRARRPAESLSGKEEHGKHKGFQRDMDYLKYVVVGFRKRF